MRHLVLFRHGKAESDETDDAKRSLTLRGSFDATAAGRWLAARSLAIDRVVVSPARRAQQTWEAAAAEMPGVPEPVSDDRVYRNTVEDLMAVIGDTPPAVTGLVLVGHNPSIQELAQTLDDGAGEAAARRSLGNGFPTSGIAVFAVDGDWAEVDSATGRLVNFAVSRAASG
ncbi:MAG: histidine phosphatase family protein [Pseudonocardiales bacterium]